MPEEALNQIIMSDRELTARLIRMGAVAPMDLDLLNAEKVEDITSALPTVYGCRYSTADALGNSITVDCYALSPEGVNRQFFQAMQGKSFSAFPDRSIIPEYSPEAWKGFLQQDFNGIDRKDLLQRFRRWGIPLESRRVQYGFGKINTIHELRAEDILKRDQQDLLSRLVRMGVVEPLDLDRISIKEADKIIRNLPALTESEIIWKGEKDYERKYFINLAEFHISNRGTAQDFHPELDDPVSDDELRTPRYEQAQARNDVSYDSDLHGPNVRAGAHTLHMQERLFFSQNEGVEEKIVHRREEITGGYAWLNYFRQNQQEALPNGSTTALRNAFKNWGIQLKRGNLELGFAKSVTTNRKEAQLSYYKVLFSKVVNAGIAEMMPKQDWYNLDLKKAEAFAAKIPMLPEMEHPGEWLDFFRSPAPRTPAEIALLEARFYEAGIYFDEKMIVTAFPKIPGSGSKTKGIQTMQDITVDDYKKMIGRLTASGKMERMGAEEFKNLTLEDARDYVRGFDAPASDKQKVLLRSMYDEGRLDIKEKDIDLLSRQEASFVIDHAPKQEISKEKPEHPMEDDTRKELRRLIDNGDTPQIPYSRFNNLSEEEARSKIDQVYARRPATEKQKEFIREALEKKSFPPAAMRELFKKPTITPADVESLNQLQATKLIGSLPATEKQIEAVKQLVEDKRIEPLASYDLSAADANRILNKAYRETAEIDPNGPATKRQKEALEKLLADKQLPAEITPEKIKDISFAEAGQLLENSPATQAQKDMIGRLVHEGKLTAIPREDYSNLNRKTASLLIDIANGKRPESDMPKFSEVERPPTEAQMKLLEELREKGKIQEIPENLTRNTASQLINDSTAGEPLAPQQMAIIERKIAENKIPNLSEEDKAKLTQKDFARLMKESKSVAPEKTPEKAPEQQAPEKGKNKEKAHNAPGMSR